MANLKNLKELPANVINFVSILEKFIPNEKPKYKELLIKLLGNHIKRFDPGVISEIKEYTNGKVDVVEMTPFERRFIYSLLNTLEYSKILQFIRFIEYNEKFLIERKDLTTYNNFDEIEMELNKTELKLISKEMEGQIITIYSDNEWLFIKPLTYDSSRKYGANTKWCTTSEKDSDYFFRYTSNGVLVYCLNKLTGYKVAAYKDVDSGDINFYDQRDQRIDSISCEIPDELFRILRKEIKECNKPNEKFIDIQLRIDDIRKNRNVPKKSSLDGIPVPPMNEMVDDQPRAIERNFEYDGDLATDNGR